MDNNLEIAVEDDAKKMITDLKDSVNQAFEKAFPNAPTIEEMVTQNATREIQLAHDAMKKAHDDYVRWHTEILRIFNQK